jgi:hypothetical protein
MQLQASREPLNIEAGSLNGRRPAECNGAVFFQKKNGGSMKVYEISDNAKQRCQVPRVTVPFNSSFIEGALPRYHTRQTTRCTPGTVLMCVVRVVYVFQRRWLCKSSSRPSRARRSHWTSSPPTRLPMSRPRSRTRKARCNTWELCSWCCHDCFVVLCSS